MRKSWLIDGESALAISPATPLSCMPQCTKENRVQQAYDHYHSRCNASRALPTAITTLSVPHWPTILTPIGHWSSHWVPVSWLMGCPLGRLVGIDIAGNPASEAGTVKTSWTYELRSDLPLSVSSGAVRIADGWMRTSTRDEESAVSMCWVCESEK